MGTKPKPFLAFQATIKCTYESLAISFLSKKVQFITISFTSKPNWFNHESSYPDWCACEAWGINKPLWFHIFNSLTETLIVLIKFHDKLFLKGNQKGWTFFKDYLLVRSRRNSEETDRILEKDLRRSKFFTEIRKGKADRMVKGSSSLFYPTVRKKLPFLTRALQRNII